MMIPVLRPLVSIVAVFAMSLPATGNPDPSPDPNAQVVFVRKDCGPAGSEMGNCFESMLTLSEFTSGWIWTTRNPTAVAPLTVDIGPGRFGEFQCPNTQATAGAPRAGHVSVRGAGRGISILDGPVEDPAALGGVFGLNCTNLSFSDLTAVGPQYGVRWGGGGDATWTNVDMETYDPPSSFTGAWFDQCNFLVPGMPSMPNAGEHSLHFFFGSRSRSFGATSFFASSFFSQCADSWFYGGDIELTFDDPSAPYASGAVDGGVVVLSGNAHLQAFGTSIRGRTNVPLNSGLLRGVTIRANTIAPQNEASQFHIHGGIVSLKASASAGDTNIIGLDVQDNGQQPAGENGLAHTLATAFVLNPSGAGTATRIVTSNGGVVQSPLLWQAGSEPPASSNADLLSADGQDLFVETDCSGLGDCDSAGAQSHLMVYDGDCAVAGPWRDSMTGRCRGDTGP